MKKPKKKKLLAEAMAKAAAAGTTVGVDISTAAAAAPTSTTTTTSSAVLAASVYGEGARASVELRRERAIRLEDVQNLVLWVLGEGSSPRWAFVKVREGEEEEEEGAKKKKLSSSSSLSHSPTHSPLIAHSRCRTRP